MRRFPFREQHLEASRETSGSTAPIVVVGAGPVGVRLVAELSRRCPARHMVLYGDEEWEPYDRVQLSSILMGDAAEEALFRGMQLPVRAEITRHIGVRVVAIDRTERKIRDSRGNEQPFSVLVLATGSSAHVPDVPGIALPGVYRFRQWRDAERLSARRVRSRSAVVLGGGLLGLETARAMRRFQTAVTVIEHNPHLMGRQLDSVAGAALARHVESLGIRVVTGDGVRAVRGHQGVDAVELMSGATIACDTIVLATGIRPNIDLALQSGLPVGRGIRVDDQLRTIDQDIFAVGECAEHRGVVHGLVAPGLEQAAVVAGVIAGDPVQYTGSVAATSLKVAGLPVFSVGRLADNDVPEFSRRHGWAGEHNTCTRLVMSQGRLVGACGVGTLREFPQLREAVVHRRRLAPWRLWRYRRGGRLWPEHDEDDASAWPAEAVICNCARVTRGQLSAAIAAGCDSFESVCLQTRAATTCGSCRPLVQRLVSVNTPVAAVRGAKWLIAGAVLTLVVALLILGANLPDPTSAATGRWPPFWRNAGFKQLSGYGLVTLVLLSLGITWRKRLGGASGDTANWRVVHVALAALAGMVLLAHTGGRTGINLNLALAATFLAALVLGAVSAVSVAREHRNLAAVRVRRRMTYVHLLVTWPLPALLVAHVVKAYFF